MTTEIALKENQDLIILQSNIAEAISESKKIIIFEESQIESAGFYIKKFGELDKALEKLRKQLVQPLNEETKTINAFFKSIQQTFNPEQDRLKKESNEMLTKIRKRQEEERKKEQEELEDAILDEAEMFNDESVLENIPKIEFKKEKITENNLTTKRDKKWRVTDIEKIPRKYLVLDEKLINSIRKDYDYESESPIEGIEFYYEESVRIKWQLKKNF